jgi:hypothetical protein
MTDGTNPMKLYRSLLTYPFCKLDRFEEYKMKFSLTKGSSIQKSKFTKPFLGSALGAMFIFFVSKE